MQEIVGGRGGYRWTGVKVVILINLLVPAAVPANAASFSAEKQHFKNIK